MTRDTTRRRMMRTAKSTKKKKKQKRNRAQWATFTIVKKTTRTVWRDTGLTGATCAGARALVDVVGDQQHVPLARALRSVREGARECPRKRRKIVPFEEAGGGEGRNNHVIVCGKTGPPRSPPSAALARGTHRGCNPLRSEGDTSVIPCACSTAMRAPSSPGGLSMAATF